MKAGNEKPGWLEERNRLLTDQRQVEVARPRTLRIERRAVLPAMPRDRAAAKHDARSIGNLLPDHAAELLEPLGVAAEGETQDIGAFLLVGQAALAIVLRLGGHQLGIV